MFKFLVNYVQYPRGFQLDGRTIVVAGRTTLGGPAACARLLSTTARDGVRRHLRRVRRTGFVHDDAPAARGWKIGCPLIAEAVDVAGVDVPQKSLVNASAVV